MSGWGDAAARENQRDISGYRSPWRTPTRDSKDADPWQPPGHTRMFRRAEGDSGPDDPKRSFMVRKRHGWWGKEERYDQDGRLMQ